MLWRSVWRVPAVHAQEADWKVGLARVKITPPQPVFMAGYASRNKPYEGIHDDLFAKVLVLEDKGGRAGVLVTSDLIGFPAEIATPLRERIAKQAKTAAELGDRQLVAHAHGADAEPRSDAARRAGAGRRRADGGLHEGIVRQDCQRRPARRPASCSRRNCRGGAGVVHFVMNRREFTIDRGVILGVNPRGLADRSVPVLRIDDPSGKLLAVVCGAASHNTTLGGQDYEISGDYAGHAQRLIEEQHPGVHGDVRARLRGRCESVSARDARDCSRRMARSWRRK